MKRVSHSLALAIAVLALPAASALAQQAPPPGTPKSPFSERQQPLPAPDGRGAGPKGPESRGPDQTGPEAKGKSPHKGPEAAPPQAQAQQGPPRDRQLPDSPAKKARQLADLYATLAAAGSEEEAKPIAERIERLWLTPSSDTVGVLMERAVKAANEKKFDLASNLLDAAVDLAPDYAEAFNRRAYVNYMLSDVPRALGDLRRVLALDPNHFKAMEGLGQLLKDLGQKKAALAVFRRLKEVHPFSSGIETTVEELEREVEGQDT